MSDYACLLNYYLSIYIFKCTLHTVWEWNNGTTFIPAVAPVKTQHNLWINSVLENCHWAQAQKTWNSLILIEKNMLIFLIFTWRGPSVFKTLPLHYHLHITFYWECKYYHPVRLLAFAYSCCIVKWHLAAFTFLAAISSSCIIHFSYIRSWGTGKF